MRRAVTALVTGSVLLVAVAVQLSVLARLDLPAVAPDAVLVTVAALGCARGAVFGAAAGFAGGLLLDLAPPADHPAGQWALVLTVVGWLAGRLAAHLCTGRAVDGRRLALVALLGAGGTLAYVLLSAALGSRWPAAAELGQLALAAGTYAAVLAGPLLPATAWLVRRPAAGRW